MLPHGKYNLQLRGIREEIIVVVEDLLQIDCNNDQRRNTHTLDALNDIAYSVVLNRLYDTVRYPINNRPRELFTEKLAYYLLLKGLGDLDVEFLIDNEFAYVLDETTHGLQLYFEPSGYDLWRIRRMGSSSLVIENDGDYRQAFFFQAMETGRMPTITIENHISQLEEFCQSWDQETRRFSRVEGN